MTDLSLAAERVRSRYPDAVILRDEPMSGHTSFRIGGTVPYMFVPRGTDELIYILDELRSLDVAPLVIGKGTNLLVEEGRHGFPVIKTHGGLNAVKLTGDAQVIAGCGATLAQAAQFAQVHGLSGLEFAHGIPGTVGGGIFMNAGAYGGELGNITASVTAVRSDGSVYTLSGDECGFSYRHSVFTDSGDLVLRAVFSLDHGDPEEIRAVMDELAKKRRSSQPLDKPSAGSTFKRPNSGYAAAMIDEAGLKGYRVGGAAVSEKHAGFVVNLGGATFTDVMSVIDHVRRTVYIKTGTVLEPEVRIIRMGCRIR